MPRDLVTAEGHTIPCHRLLFATGYTNVHDRLVGEHRLEQIGLWLGQQRAVEDTVVPSLARPAKALAVVVYHTPIGQAHDTVEIHVEIVRPHHRQVGLALIEDHVGKAPAVAREVHIAIVVSLDVRDHRQVAGQRVGLPVAAARVHGHGDRPRVVVAAQQSAQQTVGRHAPVVERQVGIGLELIAQAPHDDAGVVAVTLYPLRHIVLPVVHPRLPASGILCEPLVIELIDDKDAIFVTEAVEVFAIGIVGAADVVEAEVLEQLDALLDGTRIGGGTESTERVVVGNAFEDHLTAVELKAEGGTVFDGTDSEGLRHPVGDTSAVVTEGQLSTI